MSIIKIDPTLNSNQAVVVPESISDRQFFQHLAHVGVITEVEAIDAVATGTLPSSMLYFIDQLPTNERFAASMLLRGATTFERSHPLTNQFGSLCGFTTEQLDQFWIEASKL